jgi:hypothetical protein
MPRIVRNGIPDETPVAKKPRIIKQGLDKLTREEVCKANESLDYQKLSQSILNEHQKTVKYVAKQYSKQVVS